MLNFKATVKGLSELQHEIEVLSHELSAAEKEAALAAGEPIRERWAGLVPVFEGHYRDSLTVAWVEGQGAVVGTRWLPEVPRNEQPALYSKRLEFGDADIPAHPSARPALRAARKAAKDAGSEPLKAVVRGRKPRKPRPT